MSEGNGEQQVIQMPVNHQPDRIEPGQPEHMIVKLEAILEPELPARGTMSDHDMEELIESLDTIGQRDPIQLMRRGPLFEIIDGHRRFLAAKELNSRYAHRKELRWTCLRAEVYPEGDPNALAARLHANIIREQLNPAEEAVFMRQAMEMYQLDLAGLCKLFHRSEDYINARFKLIYGDPQVLQSVLDGKISMSCAHQLNRITDEPARRMYLDCALKTSPPGRVVQNWVREWEKNAPYLAQQQQIEAAPAPAPDLEVYVRACVFCGGHLDQGNIVDVPVHNYELERILQQLGVKVERK